MYYFRRFTRAEHCFILAWSLKNVKTRHEIFALSSGSWVDVPSLAKREREVLVQSYSSGTSSMGDLCGAGLVRVSIWTVICFRHVPGAETGGDSPGLGNRLHGCDVSSHYARGLDGRVGRRPPKHTYLRYFQARSPCAVRNFLARSGSLLPCVESCLRRLGRSGG
jgi:hypothetical protein